MFYVDLRTHRGHGARVSRYVCLRELSGDEEQYWDSPTGLIDRLLLDRPGVARRPGEAQTLTVTEIDRVLAAIYRSLYGDVVECHTSCAACGVPYALSFTLTDLRRSIAETNAEDETLLDGLEGPDDTGVYRAGQLAFRIPTGEDLTEVARLGREDVGGALRTRCVVDGGGNVADAVLDRLMSLVGPVLDTDVSGVCTECEAEESIRFCIDEFLFAALRREGTLLMREVHELARAYRWSRREILEMPRHERRQYAGLVLAERAAEDSWA